MIDRRENIVIIGAGLVGAVWSIMLRGLGFENVTVLEKRSDLRLANVHNGRSINLALSDRGLKALSLIGLDKKILSMAIPMYGRAIHEDNEPVKHLPYSAEGKFINSVSRTELNRILLDEAEKVGVNFVFEADVDWQGSLLRSNNKPIEADFVFAADGANSPTRNKIDPNSYSEVLTHSYKEIDIPAINGEYALEPNALHIWPRGSYMLIALPNLDKSFTATLFLPSHGANSFDEIENQPLSFFKRHFKDFVNLVPSLKVQFKENPVSHLSTVKCEKWSEENVLLIGDAAHGIVPFYGQGMNAGFEDCTVLYELIQHAPDWDELVFRYTNDRKVDADAIAELALRNFIEMRDHVADEDFLFRKKIESKIHEAFPDKWQLLYTMVTFSDTPYSIALKKDEFQQKVIDEIVTIPAIHKKINEEGLPLEVIKILQSKGLD